VSEDHRRILEREREGKGLVVWWGKGVWRRKKKKGKARWWMTRGSSSCWCCGRVKKSDE